AVGSRIDDRNVAVAASRQRGPSIDYIEPCACGIHGYTHWLYSHSEGACHGIAGGINDADDPVISNYIYFGTTRINGYAKRIITYRDVGKDLIVCRVYYHHCSIRKVLSKIPIYYVHTPTCWVYDHTKRIAAHVNRINNRVGSSIDDG